MYLFQERIRGSWLSFVKCGHLRPSRRTYIKRISQVASMRMKEVCSFNMHHILFQFFFLLLLLLFIFSYLDICWYVLVAEKLFTYISDDINVYTCTDDPTKDQEMFSTVPDIPSKLQQLDYFTQPGISELEAKERAEPGYCSHVKDFVVGRHGYGSIKFLGETDVRKLDLETQIQFNYREVIVYTDESMKPPVGEGLNKPAEITLLNIKCVDKRTGMRYMDGLKVDKYTEMLKMKAVAQGAEFMSYDAVGGEWKFRVKHF